MVGAVVGVAVGMAVGAGVAVQLVVLAVSVMNPTKHSQVYPDAEP